MPEDGDEQAVIALTNGFTRDYKLWNDQAQGQRESDPERVEAWRSYDALLSKYVVAGLRPQNLSFSSHSPHDPATDQVTSVEVVGETAMVSVRHAGPYGVMSDYRFHYVKEGAAWRLSDLRYVDDRGGGSLL